MTDLNSRIDYDGPPKGLEKTIKPSSIITEKEANINFDGKQFLVRFPKDIVNAIGVKKGDRIKFRVVLGLSKTNKTEKIEIEYIRSDDIEK